METEVRVPGQPGLSAKLCLKGETSKSNLIPYSNPAKRTMKKASLHVQQYKAITAHPSRWEIRVSLTPPHCTMRGWTQSLKHSRKTATETYPQYFGWFFFCHRISLNWPGYPWSLEFANLLPQPPVYLGAQACTFRQISHYTNMKPKLLPSKKWWHP